MSDIGVVMPYDYEDSNFDIEGYKTERKLKRIFTKFYEDKSKEALENCPLKSNKKKFRHFKANLEEYYGEVLEIIEASPTGIIKEVLDSEDVISEMYNKLDLPEMNYRTGRKINKPLTNDSLENEN